MKILIIALLCFAGIPDTTPELETIRKNYQLAPTDKLLCKEMIATLDNSNDPVYMAYLGAFQAIWAKHIRNPLEKLGTFNRGKKNIEKAVSLSASNVEIRTIRLSIQLNAPGFLGYSNNIEEDKQFIIAKRHSNNSKTLQIIIDGLLSK